MSDDPFQAALNQMNETLASVQAEHERLRATSETAEQSRNALAQTLAAAADSLRATLPQPTEAVAGGMNL